jgi:hypothetical protein
VCDDVTGGPTTEGGDGSADFFHILHKKKCLKQFNFQFNIQFNKLLLGFMYEQRMGVV